MSWTGEYLPTIWKIKTHHTLFPPLSPLAIVRLFLTSMSLVIFCLLFSFVDYVPVKGEIIWYLSLTAWLISLSDGVILIIYCLGKHVNGRCSFSYIMKAHIFCQHNLILTIYLLTISSMSQSFGGYVSVQQEESTWASCATASVCPTTSLFPWE